MNDEEFYYSFEELQDLVLKYQAKCLNLQKDRLELQERIDKAIEYIKHSQSYGTMAQVMSHLKPYVNGDELLEILGHKENE